MTRATCEPCRLPDTPARAGIGARWTCGICSTPWKVTRAEGHLRWVAEPAKRVQDVPRWIVNEPEDPHLDDLTRADLVEAGGAPPVVAKALSDWAVIAIGARPGERHCVGTFLGLLTAMGYRVTEIDSQRSGSVPAAPSE